MVSSHHEVILANRSGQETLEPGLPSLQRLSNDNPLQAIAFDVVNIMGCRDREFHGIDAFAQSVVHSQVTRGVKLYGPDSVVVGARPRGRKEREAADAIAGKESIYQRFNS